MSGNSFSQFEALICQITHHIGGKDMNEDLSNELMNAFGPETTVFKDISALCALGDKEGWLCSHEHGGVRYGRVIQPTEKTHGFSVDVVCMKDLKGPHHVHPEGEIDLVMPIDEGARFDGQGAGWKVYGPMSAHYPTVMGGKAYVLYLLPNGKIEFTK